METADLPMTLCRDSSFQCCSDSAAQGKQSIHRSADSVQQPLLASATSDPRWSPHWSKQCLRAPTLCSCGCWVHPSVADGLEGAPRACDVHCRQQQTAGRHMCHRSDLSARKHEDAGGLWVVLGWGLWVVLGRAAGRTRRGGASSAGGPRAHPPPDAKQRTQSHWAGWVAAVGTVPTRSTR